ncbi:MAG: hypothetical protein QJR07_20930 [Acetobacteraceae bacterium]|nr:hypothetical protein [Acetobacteraceae bacterium]
MELIYGEPQVAVARLVAAIRDGDVAGLRDVLSHDTLSYLLQHFPGQGLEALLQGLRADLLREIEKGVGVAGGRVQEDGHVLVPLVLDVPQGEVTIVNEPSLMPVYMVPTVKENEAWKVDLVSWLEEFLRPDSQ